MNLKIFPAFINSEGQKVPLIKNWYENASNDPEQHRRWQQEYGDRIKLWGIPCGEANGIIALDIDVKKVNGLDSLQKITSEFPNTMYQRTPSGGYHLIFQNPPGQKIGNTVNTKIGLDTRGYRGWIAYYGFSGEQIAPMPTWFTSLSKPEPVKISGETFIMSPHVMEGILQDACENIRQAAAGESNNVLNLESFRVGQLIASGFDRQRAESELFLAAKTRGKPDYEAKATIKSGLDSGGKNPIICPFPNEAPQAPPQALSAPPVPEAPVRWTPKFFTLDDLQNTSKLKQPQLFKDWSTEDIHLTTADGGTGKSTLKLLEAICLALGEPFLGFPCLQAGKTLYITGEDKADKLGAIVGAMCRQMGFMDGSQDGARKLEIVRNSILIKKDPDLCLIDKTKSGLVIPNRSAMNNIMQAVEDIKPKMIVFDPLASLWGSEALGNDMSAAVAKFAGELSERAKACVDLINHMGKQSSSIKDMSQFAGRGGSALPSHSRVNRVFRKISDEECMELLPTPLSNDQKAIMVNVSKFTDNSPLIDKPFILIRTGYLFERVVNAKVVENVDRERSDIERVFTFVQGERAKGKFPTEPVITGYFSVHANSISKARVKNAISIIQYQGYNGGGLKWIENPDLGNKDKCLILTNFETGEEL